MPLLLALIAFLVVLSFVISNKIIPFIIFRMNLRGITVPDMNKFSKTKVPLMGGTGVLFGFLAAVLVAIFFYSHLDLFPGLKLTTLLAGIFTIFMMNFLGVFDDLIGWKDGIRQYQHALVPLLASLPLVALSVGTSTSSVPFIGTVFFGIWYSLVIVPIAVTGASNATNMLAGMNGLEAGLGIINTTTMMLIGLLYGKIEMAILMAGMLGALIAFIRYNWNPAKIFPGDSLTLMVGASLAAASIIGDVEKFGLALFALFFVEFVLKARYKFQSESFGIPQKDGTLKAPERVSSLPHLVLKWGGKMREEQVVGRILLAQSLIALFVLSAFIFRTI